MKKLTLLALLVLFGGLVYGQTINEKKIYEGLKQDPYTLYDFSYDNNTESYVYVIYDTVSQKSRIESNKGGSGEYNYFQTADIVYDNSGNYFAIAVNTMNEEPYTSEYFLLKNGAEVFRSANLQYPVSKRDDGIYFIANDNGKDVRVKYNFTNSRIEFGTRYDTIFLAAIRKTLGEGEPAYEIGFTNDGKEYYAASKNNKHYFIIGEKEYGPYDEIQYYNTAVDNNGGVCFIARETKGSKNSYFVVQDGKEYKKFASVYLTSTFDKNNAPLYTASENFKEEYPQDAYVIQGNEKVSRNFTRGAYDIMFTPSGKLVYTGSDTLKNGNYITRLFIDGKEYASSNSLWNIKFYNNNDVPYYYASDENYNTAVYKGKERVTDRTYSYISDFRVNKSGQISYAGTINGDYEKEIPNASYYMIGKEKIGPFDNLYVGEYEPVNYLINDNNDYMYVGSTSAKGPEGEMNNKYFAASKNWKTNEFDFVSDLMMYNNDFYFTGFNYGNENTPNITKIFKNGSVIAEYSTIYNTKLDEKKGIITLLAQKDNKVYFVEIKL